MYRTADVVSTQGNSLVEETALGPVIRIVRRPRPSEVFATYWRFACERQRIFYRRLAGVTPTTTDPILASFRFTNAYRASDRVSQYLINEIIPNSRATVDDVFFRVILFKLFNRISTWELIEASLGPVHWPDFDLDGCDGLLARAMRDGRRVYSAAYIMPMPSLGASTKHSNHLRLLDRMMADGLPDRISSAKTMSQAYQLLLTYPSVGPFLAFQYVIDLNYSPLVNFSEMEFVVAGPGAIDGIRKCFENPEELPFCDVIRATADMADDWVDRLGLDFQMLWGRRPQLIDYQNLFCEVDKYARVAHPDVVVRSGRLRIKQRYRHDMSPIRYGYPPKWGLPKAAVSVDALEISYPASRSRSS